MSEAASAHLTDRERQFFDQHWQTTEVGPISGELSLPGVEPLSGKRVLICSCGTGEEPVKAARAGAKVHAFDISPVAVEKAREIARFNGVDIDVRVMDFHALDYPDEYFDLIYGSAILHHVDCERAGREIRRCLRPGGVGFFAENSDRNPILRLARRLIFGKPGRIQKRSFLFFRRSGTTDEYPLTESEIETLSTIFEGQLERRHEQFMFFELLAIHGIRIRPFHAAMRTLDRVVGRVFPFLRRYSFLQEVVLHRPAADPSTSRTAY